MFLIHLLEQSQFLDAIANKTNEKRKMHHKIYIKNHLKMKIVNSVRRL